MLRESLYTVAEFKQDFPPEASLEEQDFRFTVRLNPQHDIFKGHFPGNPVLPGVCQIEMVRELSEYALKGSFLLNQASQVKYLNLVNPEKIPVLDIRIRLKRLEAEGFNLTSEVSCGDTVFMKLKGTLSEYGG